MSKAKHYVVGRYSDGLTTILATPGQGPDTLERARQRIHWQTQGGFTDTEWFICEPDPSTPYVMIARETGERLTVTRGALTVEAHNRLCKEIWP